MSEVGRGCKVIMKALLNSGVHFEKMRFAMHQVYILKSELDGRYHYGQTERNIEMRVDEHNSGRSSYTRQYRPWNLVWFASFTSKDLASEFEKYLNTPSGHAFSRKRLI